MTKKANLIIPAFALVAILGAGYGINQARAEDSQGRLSIIERIAEKFNLNKDDVQKVFDENREEHQAQRKINLEKKLDEFVSKGELTAEKKILILAKVEELQKEIKEEREKNREEHRNLSKEERKIKMDERKKEIEAEREDLEKWANENGIDAKYLLNVMLRQGGGSKGGLFGKGLHGGNAN